MMVFMFLFAADNAGSAEAVKNAYVDPKGSVHILTQEGQHRQITHGGRAGMLKLAPDKETVAWLVLRSWVAEGDDIPGSEELIIYRDGKINSIRCTPFIRDYWFWKNGDQIAIDCGGRHFAGREILYDTRTLKEIAAFDQADVPLAKRPDWSSDEN